MLHYQYRLPADLLIFNKCINDGGKIFLVDMSKTSSYEFSDNMNILDYIEEEDYLFQTIVWSINTKLNKHANQLL